MTPNPGRTNENFPPLFNTSVTPTQKKIKLQSERKKNGYRGQTEKVEY